MWQPIDDLIPDGGGELIIRLKNPDASRIGFLGASIHQMARWSVDGDIICAGRTVPREYVEAAFPLPPFPVTKAT